MSATRQLRSRRSVGPLRHLGLACLLAASLALSACSSDGGSDGDDPRAEPSGSPSVTQTPTPTPDSSGDPDAVAHREVGTFSAPGLRGVEDGSVTLLESAQDARDWVEGLGATPQVVDEVSTVTGSAAVADDESLHGLVLHTGCLAPQSWTLTEGRGELSLQVVANPKEATINCVAAVTTLAVVAVSSD